MLYRHRELYIGPCMRQPRSSRDSFQAEHIAKTFRISNQMESLEMKSSQYTGGRQFKSRGIVLGVE